MVGRVLLRRYFLILCLDRRTGAEFVPHLEVAGSGVTSGARRVLGICAGEKDLDINGVVRDYTLGDLAHVIHPLLVRRIIGRLTAKSGPLMKDQEGKFVLGDRSSVVVGHHAPVPSDAGTAGALSEL